MCTLPAAAGHSALTAPRLLSPPCGGYYAMAYAQLQRSQLPVGIISLHRPWMTQAASCRLSVRFRASTTQVPSRWMWHSKSDGLVIMAALVRLRADVHL
jgi:hypothetical protein